MNLVTRVVTTALTAASLASAQTAPTGEPVSLSTPTGTVSGTLLIPLSAAPVPLVVVIAGSGPTDRDGNSAALPGANNSLRLLAEGLAARGIASVRYDKRGIAASRAAGPSEADLRFDMYADDAAAWVKRFRADIRFSTITIVGHSEGSLIGLLAVQRGSADGFVSIAGAGRRADAVIREQLKAAPPELVAITNAMLDTLVAGRTLSAPVPPALLSLFRPSVQPYMISWLRVDPQAEIAQLTVPVLIAQGTTDVQVAPSEARLLAAAQPKATLVMVDGMNHVLKRASGTAVEQLPAYSDPALAVVPELIEAVARFVKAVPKR
jgi:pimeloyl-ACP methyl ester carboxylesterase